MHPTILASISLLVSHLRVKALCISKTAQVCEYFKALIELNNFNKTITWRKKVPLKMFGFNSLATGTARVAGRLKIPCVRRPQVLRDITHIKNRNRNSPPQ